MNKGIKNYVLTLKPAVAELELAPFKRLPYKMEDLASELAHEA